MNAQATTRRIGLLTSGRQDWWLLEPVARAIAAHEALNLTVLATGTHLLAGCGRTIEAVRAGGWPVEAVDLFDPALGPQGRPEVAPADLARLAGGLAEAMDRSAIDILLVLGDRIETLSAAVTAVAGRRWLAHVHGGDRAAGEFDDACRHAITKLAHLHLPATAASAERIERLGEPAGRIRVVGSPALDAVLAGGLAEASAAREAVGLGPDEPFAVVLLHPAGLGEAGEAAQAAALAGAVADAGLRALLVGPNADPGAGAIWQMWQQFSREKNWPIVPTVDRPVFLALLRQAVALVGNSSAGMVESAAVDAVVIDVGRRQHGREHSDNVVHVAGGRAAIAAALTGILDRPDEAQRLRSAPCRFGDGRAGERIAAALAEMDLDPAYRIKLNTY